MTTHTVRRLAAGFGLLALSLFATSARAQYSAVITADNPIHYWQLNETNPLFEVATDSGTVAGNDGTFIGGINLAVPSFNGSAGTAAHFDGVEGPIGTRIDTGTFHPGNSVTVEGWVKADSLKAFNAILARWDGSYEIDVNGNNGYGNFVVFNDIGTFGLAQSTQFFTTNAWHHVAGVFTAGTATMYLDGVKGTSQTIGGVLRDSNGGFDGQVRIGATRGGENGGSFNWTGSLDEVAVYDHALTEGQIKAHFVAGGGKLPKADQIKFETNNEANFALPSAYGSFPTIPRPSNTDYGQLATVTVPPGSGLLLNANSGPVTRLNDGVIMDQDIDCCGVGGNGPNGQVDAVFFAESGSALNTGRYLVTLPNLADVSSIATYAGINTDCCGNRANQAYSVYGSDDANPSTLGNIDANPDWSVIGHVLGGPARQTAALLSSSTGSLGVYKHLLFVVNANGDDVHDFYGEIDVFARPVPEPSTLVLLGVAGAVALAYRRRRFK